MAIIISVAVQKGGVGKTTTVVNTAHALAKYENKHVLVVDMDPQHNSSMVLGKVTPYEQPRSVINLFEDKTMNFASCAVPSKYKNVDLIASHIDLFGLGESLGPSNPKGIVALKSKLDSGSLEKYDFILIDCPPNLGGPFLNNALVISDYYIIPVESESYFALKGMQQFQESVSVIKETINPNLELLGVLITMYDPRTNASKAMVDAIRNYFGHSKVFGTIIHRNTAINKANMLRQAVCHLDTRTPGCQNYRTFAAELLEWAERIPK